MLSYCNPNQRLNGHGFKRGRFFSWRTNVPQTFYLLPFTMGPKDPCIWRFSQSFGAFFISPNVPEEVRVEVLQTENYRMTWDKDHHEAVAFAFTQIGKKIVPLFAEALLPRYERMARSLDFTPYDMHDVRKTINLLQAQKKLE